MESEYMVNHFFKILIQKEPFYKKKGLVALKYFWRLWVSI